MGRKPCCSKEGLNKGAWTPMEDKILIDYLKVHGEGKWRNLPKKAGLKRCGKSCRLRWLNYLRPDIKRGNITRDEEDLIIRLHKLLGNRWSLIAGRLPGRTDNEIKNYWNTNIGKKLQQQIGVNSGPAKSIPVTTIDNVVGGSSSILSSSSPCNLVVRTKAMRCTKIFIPTPIITTNHDSTTNNDRSDDKVMAVESSSSSFSLSPILSEQQPAVSGSSPTFSGSDQMENNFNFMFNFDMDDPFLSELLNAADQSTTTTAGDQVGDSFNRNEEERSCYFPPNISQTVLFLEETQHNDLELWINGFSS